MKSIIIPKHGEPEVLEICDQPEPELRPGTVRIAAKACGVNFADVLMRMGRYPEAPPPPFTPGYEVAGTVLEIAEDVDTPAWLVPGADVMAVTRFGGYAEQIVTPIAKTAPLPQGWDYVQGAAFLITNLTAWLGLKSMGRIGPVDRVLLHGIAGGVGLAGLQIARAAGCCVAGTCSAKKAPRVAEMGAELVIDAQDPELEAKVRAWRPTVIFEPRGGAGLKQSLECVEQLGRVVSFGFNEIMAREKVDPQKAQMATGRLLWFNPLTLVERSIGVFMLNIMNLWDDPELFPQITRQLCDGISAGHYAPVVHKVFPFEQAVKAHHCLHQRDNIGKVVLTL